jgi:hypothetical protein
VNSRAAVCRYSINMQLTNRRESDARRSAVGSDFATGREDTCMRRPERLPTKEDVCPAAKNLSGFFSVLATWRASAVVLDVAE